MTGYFTILILFELAWGLSLAIGPLIGIPVITRQTHWNKGTRKRLIWVLYATNIGLDLFIAFALLFFTDYEATIRIMGSGVFIIGGLGLNLWSLPRAMNLVEY